MSLQYRMMRKFINNRSISKAITVLVITTVLLFSQSPVSAETLNEAVKTAGKGGKTKVISARTVKKGNRRTHEVRVLTNKGKVKTMRYPANRAGKSPKGAKQSKPKGKGR